MLMFGFIFYSNRTFDRLGREVFFSSFGAANIFLAQGSSYFAQNEAFQPLTHLWSLGVEEQFYVVWPIVLVLAHRFFKSSLLPITIILILVSLYVSEQMIQSDATRAYYLLQYRAFELLIGAGAAIFLARQSGTYRNRFTPYLSIVGVMLIVLPLFLLNEDSSFPGLNALYPCIGTCLLYTSPSPRDLSTSRMPSSA